MGAATPAIKQRRASKNIQANASSVVLHEFSWHNLSPFSSIKVDWPDPTVDGAPLPFPKFAHCWRSEPIFHRRFVAFSRRGFAEKKPVRTVLRGNFDLPLRSSPPWESGGSRR